MAENSQNCNIPIEDNDEKGRKTIQSQINELLELLVNDKNKNEDESIENIRKVLENNKHLLVYQHCKDNKVRSIIHIAKYGSKLRYDKKQNRINALVDVGYKLFKFSENSPLNDNFQALFFTAAKGDFDQLQEIINYFKNMNEMKLYDTREGDTVLGFMIKFGDHSQKQFLKCLELILDLNIDIERVDYFKNTINEIVKKELSFLEQRKTNNDIYIQRLKKIDETIEKTPKRNKDLNSAISKKYKIFQAIIKNENITNLVEEPLINSDDGENTLLQLGVIKNNVEVVKELLRKEVDPNLIVPGRNEEFPLVLSAQLGRECIFKEILKCKNITITENMFATFVRLPKSKFLNYVLESQKLDVEIQYKGKPPLYYAILRKNKSAIQSLLQRGSRIGSSCLQNINPKDLEDYFNSCIKFDNFADDTEESNYKTLLVFDFFINSSKIRRDKKKNKNTSLEAIQLVENNTEKHDSEISIVRKIASNKRLKHLLEHPLVYIYILLKWYCVQKYYYCFVILKSIFYITIAISVYTRLFNIFVAIPILLIQTGVVYYNFSEFEFEFKRYTLHFILEIFLFIFLSTITVLQFFISKEHNFADVVNVISAFIIIITSISLLLSIGYHMKFSKWVAMAKRVFKNFAILLLFFMIPITAFGTSFRILLSEKESANPKNDTEKPEVENSDFDSLPKSIFRTLVMLGGDIGDKKFSEVGGYLVFLCFTVGMAIILLNFWTGVAVSDIKEIEDQSTIVAFKNVIVFIESTERIYNIFAKKLGRKLSTNNESVSSEEIVSSKQNKKSIINMELPFLNYRIDLSKRKKCKFHYGIDLYINSQKQFKSNKYFEGYKLNHDIILKIKSLSEEKDVNVGKILMELVEKTKSIDEIYSKLRKIEQMLQNLEKKD